MIFGLSDAAYLDNTKSIFPQVSSDNKEKQNETTDSKDSGGGENGDDELSLLDKQIETIKAEIKALDKEIQVKEAQRFVEDDVNKERRIKELYELEKQVNNLTKAEEHEKARIGHFEAEIYRREKKQLPPQLIDTSDEVVQQLTKISDELTAELKSLRSELAAEVGDDFDIDEIIKTKGSAKKRAEELQSLQAVVSKATSTYVDSRRQNEISQAGKKAKIGVDTLMAQKKSLMNDVQDMKQQIKKARAKVDGLEEESRALRMLDVLLDEKLKHDAELIKHLQDHQSPNDMELPEMDIPPVTEETIFQLRAQQNIIKGLCFKLSLSQKELMGREVPENLSFMVDQLYQLNKKCIELQKKFLVKEEKHTDAIEQHIDYNAQYEE